MEPVHIINQKLYLFLSHDLYTLFINDYQISNDSKIENYHYLQKATSVHHGSNHVDSFLIIIVSKNGQWAIYQISASSKPEQKWRGFIDTEIVKNQSISLIMQIGTNIVILWSNAEMMYIPMPNSPSSVKNLPTKSYIPYGEKSSFESHSYSIRKYLPEQESLKIYTALYQSLGDKGILHMAISQSQSGIQSIYSLEINSSNNDILSGKYTLCNIHDDVMGIFNLNNQLLIQGKKKLYLWKKTQENQKEEEFFNVGLKTKLVEVLNGKDNVFVGISKFESKILYKITVQEGKISSKKQKISCPFELLQVYPSDIKNISSQKSKLIALSNKYQLLSLPKSEILVKNFNVEIKYCQLKEESLNKYMHIKKAIGQHVEEILVGSLRVVVLKEQTKHGMLLKASKIVEINQNGVYMSSPLIGTIGFNLTKSQNNNKFQFKVELKKPLPIKDESFSINSSFQITPTSIYDIQAKKQKLISSLFKQSADTISNSLVFQQQNLLVLAVNEQLHFFSYNSGGFISKFIHCFDGEVGWICKVNDFNAIAVWVYDQEFPSIQVYTIKEDGLNYFSTIQCEECPEQVINFSNTINTENYKMSLICPTTLIIASNQHLQKYQPEKTIIHSFNIPSPFASNFSKIQTIPIISQENKFFMIVWEEQNQQNIDNKSKERELKLIVGEISKKHLIAKSKLKEKEDYSDIQINYEQLVGINTLNYQKFLFGNIFQHDSTQSNVILFGQQNIALLSLDSAPLSLQNLPSKYLSSLIQSQNTKINGELLHPLKEPVTILKTNTPHRILVYNQTELHYANFQNNKLELLSYFSCVNDQFLQFRNNLSLAEISDEEFMQIFGQKMLIRQVKYVNDKVIVVLLEKSIVILEVGYNQALVVSQQLKFEAFLENGQVLKITELMQNYDEDSLFVKETQGRIYILQKNLKGTQKENKYDLFFHSYIDEDVVLLARIKDWKTRYTTINLRGIRKQGKYQQITIKRDGQLTLQAQQNKTVYL